MGLPGNQILGVVPPVGRTTANGATAFAALIEPQSINQGGRFRFAVDPGQVGANGVAGAPNWTGQSFGYTRLSKLIYTTGNTGHSVAIMRPLNWTYLTADAAVNQAVISVKDDPGAYSTNFRYPLPYGITKPAGVADNAAAGSDYVMYQLKDGTWILDTISSVSSLDITLTTNIPNITGGGVAAYTPLFFFGVIGDSDPNTKAVNWQTTTSANTNRQDLLPDYQVGAVGALHRGDPLMFYSPNTTAAGVLEAILGYYAPF